MKFQAKLSLFFVALFVVGEVLIFSTLYDAAYTNALGQVTNQLRASSRVFERVLDAEFEQLRTTTRLIARDQAFRNAVSDGDRTRIRTALVELNTLANLDFTVVLGDGNITLSATENFALPPMTSLIPEDMKQESMAGQVVARAVRLGDRIVQMAASPIFNPEEVGWLVLGVEVDHSMAQRFRQLTPINLDLAFATQVDKGNWRVLSASSKLDAISSAVSNDMSLGLNASDPKPLDGDNYLFWRIPVASAASTPVTALLYYSLDAALTPYQPLLPTLVLVAIVGAGAFFVGSVVIARSITRPLNDLDHAARSIADGEYQAVHIRSNAPEITSLAVSFNRMVRAVRDREELITYEGSHDQETNLPNANWFGQEVDRFVAAEDPFSVLNVELVTFGEIRHTLAHDEITALVREVAQRLEELAPGRVARLSTESFCICAHGQNEQEACGLAEEIVQAFRAPVGVGHLKVDVRVSVGIASYPDHAKTSLELLRSGGIAVDQALGKGTTIEVYDRAADSSRLRILSLMSEMRAALESGEIRFAYQPKMDLRTNQIIGAEALVRWISDEHGFIPPDDFIPLAERTGEVQYLTLWGLSNAIQQLGAWQAKGLSMTVSVNLSTSDLMVDNLTGYVADLLSEHGVPPQSLVLEVTESAVMADIGRARDVLTRFSDMGVGLSVDDYGTGYSSLNYLKSLPMDELKIDKSFVLRLASDDEDQILVRSTIELGHNLGLKVIAEGVEDHASLEMLRAFNCDSLQGYFIARPMPADEFEAFVRAFDYEAFLSKQAR